MLAISVRPISLREIWFDAIVPMSRSEIWFDAKHRTNFSAYAVGPWLETNDITLWQEILDFRSQCNNVIHFGLSSNVDHFPTVNL